MRRSTTKEDIAVSRSCIFSYQYDKGEVVGINHLSGEIEEIFGVSVEEYKELLYKNSVWTTMMVEEDVQEAERKLRQIIESGQQGAFRYKILKDGEERWIEEMIFPNRSKKGLLELSGIIHDITEQLVAEREIALSEKKFRRLFENNLAGVYVTHVNGTIIDCNDSFANILGYSVEEILQLKVEDLYYESKDRRPYIEQLRKEGALNNFISILKRKDGRRLVLNNNVSIHPDEDGELNIVEGTLVDVTKETEAAEALKVGEEKYRMLFEEASNAILLVSVSEEGNFVIDCNEKAREMFREEEEDLIGLQFEQVACIDGKGCGKLIDEEVSQIEWKFKRMNGDIFDADVSVSIMSIGEERINQMLIADISQRKKKEEELLRSRQSFQNIVDNSLAAIFIFTDEKLVYTNPIGDSLYNTHLNQEDNALYQVFPKKYTHLFDQLKVEAENDIHSYTEIVLGEGLTEKHFSINLVEIIHNNERSILVMLRDISLQNEYNYQKHRAELAEIANEKLQQEINRHEQTQQELLDKTSKLKAFQDSAHRLFAVTLNREHKLTSFNVNFQTAAKILLGEDPQLGTSLLDYFNTNEEGRKAFLACFQSAFRGEPKELISHFPSTAGEFWVESFFYPIMVEGKTISEISIISHDITEKIEIQKQVIKSEASNRATLLAIPDFIFRLNSKGQFTDSRIKNNTLGEMEQFVSTIDFAGHSIDEIFLNKKIAAEFKENLKIALEGEGLHTQHFSFFIGDPKDENKRFFENRFSKINDDEVVVISRDITESMEYESRLIKSVREKEILLKEVHHRVKNNLQVINSILNLQSSYVDDPETLEIINESQNRIRSMSYIHESLYQTKDFNSINFYDYVTNLVQNLVHSYQLSNNRVRLNLEIAKVSLALDQAIPCGLILNELISNSLKYAYVNLEEEGEIRVVIQEEGNQVRLEVEDFGQGLPVDFDIENSDSLGLSLVDSLVDQLDGELRCETNNGTKFYIIFEKQDF